MIHQKGSFDNTTDRGDAWTPDRLPPGALDFDPADLEAAPPDVFEAIRKNNRGTSCSTTVSGGGTTCSPTKRDGPRGDSIPPEFGGPLNGEQKQKDKAPWPLEEYDAEQLSNAVFKQNYLVEEVLAEGQPAISGGGSKVCKTSVVACELSLACAAGVPWLDRFNVPEPMRVGVVSAESGMATLQETMLRIAKARELDFAALKENLIVTPEPPNLCSDEGITSTVEWCKRRQLRLVVLDPAYLVFPQLAECSASVYAVGEVLRRFASAVLAENITPLVIHHTIKSPLNRFAPMELMDLSGSGWCEFARQWILLSRRGQYIDGTGHHELYLRIGGSAGHSSLWHLDIEEGEFQPGARRHWRTNLIQASLARKEQRDQAEEAAEREIDDKAAMIVKHLESMPGMADTENGIFKFGIGRGKAAQEAMQMLLDSGQVAYREGCVCKGGRKTGRDGYQLISQEGSTNEDD